MPKATPSKKKTARQVTKTKQTGVPTQQNEELPEAEEGREWLNPSQAMKYLGISRMALYKLMNEGILPYYTVRGLRKRRLKREDLDALMERGGGSPSKGKN